MTMEGLQGLSRDDFDLGYSSTGRGAALHVVDYSSAQMYNDERKALCGYSPWTWEYVNDKRNSTARPFPLCQRCVEKNMLFDLRVDLNAHVDA